MISIDQSYEHLQSIPKVIMDDRLSVVVIPAFFHNKWNISSGILEDQVHS